MLKGPKTAPTGIHLARMLDGNVRSIVNKILEVRDNSFPNFYKKIRYYIELRLSGHSLEFLLSQAELLPEEKDMQKKVKQSIIDVLPLIDDFCSQHDIQWFKPFKKKVKWRFLENVDVPLAPVGIALIDDRLCYLFSPTWKTIGLTAQQFRIWATFVKNGLIDTNPDFDGFIYIDVSENPDTKVRELSVKTDADTTDYLTPLELSWVRRDVQEALNIVSSIPKKQKPKRDAKGEEKPPSFDFG